MKAEVARALRNAHYSKQELDLNAIYSRIREQASRGYSGINIDVATVDPRARPYVAEETMKSLRAQGYTCEYVAHSDFRDSAYYIKVTW